MTTKKRMYGEAGDGVQRVWYVERLWALSEGLPTTQVAIEDIDAVDQVTWFHEGGPRPTCREITKHCRRIMDADLSYPIILRADHRVLDGMHRISRCLLEGRETIDAKIIDPMPEPDEINPWPRPAATE